MTDEQYARMCEIAEAVSELDEPPVCQCGKHYEGAACEAKAKDTP